ncbi:CCAAT-BINDING TRANSCRIPTION FACTOR-RELATED [Salix purpurea]|uniref:CCAAT-BINDING TRANSCRIPTION FACTOR-RELATED n=1 Tax=Salix purpurea TaxID=77065 RepID=A0A9Q0ZN61_SALPP|nr:CCAAT-BINDING TRANSCRIPTION FACTOR-RELATED [Salix purpurea]
MTGKRSRVSPVGSPQLSESISESSCKLEQDRFLPIANVSRIMKKSLPANAKISKEAKETVQECVSEFISFITGEASDKCQREKRKTINGDDLLWAMTILGFENYVGPLKVYLNKYRETEGEKNSMARQEDQYLSPTNHVSPGTLSAEMDLRSYNAGALCSLGTEVAAKSNGENTRFHGCQENNLMVGDFNMNRIRDHGDRNSSRAMAGQPHHGVSW